MTPEQLATLVNDFFAMVGRKEVEIYNEFSLQHEFGTFLRARSTTLKVQFERPASFFGIHSTLTKKEIDLVLFADSQHPVAAIELKFPRAHQVPIRMFKGCQDIGFLEDLVIKEQKFDFGMAIFVSDQDGFYQAKRSELGPIYSYFRDGASLTGTIVKPTGNKEPDVNLLRLYQIRWNQTPGLPALRYYVVPVTR